MGGVIESFLVALGFETDVKGLEELKEHTEHAKFALLSVVGVAAAAAAGIGAFVGSVAEGMAELNDFAATNEVSASSVAALGRAAEQNHSSLEAVKDSIAGINRVTGEAARGIGRGAMIFQKLGMSARDATGKIRSADAMLESVADKIKGLSRQEQIATLEKLGIDRSMVTMLKDGGEAFREMRAEAQGGFMFSDEDYERAELISKLFVKAKHTIKDFISAIAVGLFPQVERVIKGYLEWYKATREVLATNILVGIKALATAVGFLWDWVVRIVSALYESIAWLMKFKATMYAAAAALAFFLSLRAYDFAVSAAAGFMKMASAAQSFTMRMLAADAATMLLPALIGAIVIAIGLLVDDLVNFAEGNDSFIGDLVKKYPMILPIINMITDGIKQIWQWLKGLWVQMQPAFMKMAASAVHLAKALWPVLVVVGKVVAWLIEQLLPAIVLVSTIMAETLASAIETVVDIFVWLMDVASSVVEGIAQGVDFLVSAWTSGAELIKSAYDAVFTWIADKVDYVIDKVAGAIKWVGKLIGMPVGDSGATVGSTVSRAAGATASGSAGNGLPSSLQSGGAIGVAATPSTSSQSSAVNATTNISKIEINSPDPTKAGQAVREELESMNRSSIRNAQSAVAL